VDELTESAPATPAEPSALGAGSLAREMARAYVEMLRFHKDLMDKSENPAGVAADLPARRRKRVMEAPPNQISWLTLGQVAQHDPERARAAWERIQTEALDELESGHRAAVALDWHLRPWERAPFLAIRESFRREWRPRGGIEDALIDMMAQAQTMYLLWLSRLHAQALGEGRAEDHMHQTRGIWDTPRLDVAAAMDQSAATADRFNRLFLRSLRAVRDLRRFAPTVVVQHAGQVNVGGQQVNVASGFDAPDSTGLAASTGDELGSSC
jgi:hypothetical protein